MEAEITIKTDVGSRYEKKHNELLELIDSLRRQVEGQKQDRPTWANLGDIGHNIEKLTYLIAFNNTKYGF